MSLGRQKFFIVRKSVTVAPEQSLALPAIGRKKHLAPVLRNICLDQVAYTVVLSLFTASESNLPLIDQP